MAEDAKENAEGSGKKGKKGLLIAILAVVLLAGGGGAAFFMMKGKKDADPHAAEEAHRKKEMHSKVFVNLEPFTVNLADEEDRFVQVAVVLEVLNNETAEEIKVLMPAVRNRVLLLLSSKYSKDLLSVKGKELLAKQIAESTARAIGWEPSAARPKSKPKAKAKPRSEDDENAADDAEKTADAAKEGGDGEEDGDEAERKPAPKPNPNPIAKVHFAQFIVQ
jgi:flagellar FliL protein